MINELNTSVIHNRELCYPANPPFSPHAGFPEYAFDHTQDSENKLYEGVRNLLYQLGYDKKNFNTANWNPFGVFIKPGQKVIIKPNWVNHRNPMEHTMDSLITHTSLVRAVTDYALLALKGSGQLVIGDAPIQMANFDKLLINSRMKEVLEFYRAQGIHHIEVMDFRKEITVRRKGIVTKRIIRDDKEFIEVNFHENSALHEIRQDYKKFRVTNYDPDKMLRYHNLTDHIYVVDREVLEADVVIYLPKLKTHQKAGITCAMKNSVGINVQKDCLVHHRKGAISRGGDAYLHYNLFKSLLENAYESYDKAVSIPAQKRWKRVIWVFSVLTKYTQRDPYFEGSWYGNNSLWRMIHDLAGLLFYADKYGELQPTKQRQIFYLVDGIIGGEGAGPLKPQSRTAHCLIAGMNPVLIDITAARLMGFDYHKITVLEKALKNNLLGINTETLKEKVVTLNGVDMIPSEINPLTRFLASPGWIGHIEIDT